MQFLLNADGLAAPHIGVIWGDSSPKAALEDLWRNFDRGPKDFRSSAVPSPSTPSSTPSSVCIPVVTGSGWPAVSTRWPWESSLTGADNQSQADGRLRRWNEWSNWSGRRAVCERACEPVIQYELSPERQRTLLQPEEATESNLTPQKDLMHGKYAVGTSVTSRAE